MPPSGEEDHALRPELTTFEEIGRMVRVFARLGVRRVRFTGGEPLVRKDVLRLVELVHRAEPSLSLVMTTNATRLCELARPLTAAGLSGVNVSIDSLDPVRFREITRGGDLARVLAGIHAAIDAGLDVKINTVPLGGMNDDELGDIVDWAFSLGVTPRFIELMPLGEGAHLPTERFVGANAVLDALGARVERGERRGVSGHGPARYVSAADGSGRRVGFITALSDEFCASCNRVRVTARGDIRACLASRRAVSLRDLVRGGADDTEIAWAIHWAITGKADGHFFLDEAIREHESVGMSLIGG
jgi:cyclic pyranopterin phosphate synthase